MTYLVLGFLGLALLAALLGRQGHKPVAKGVTCPLCSGTISVEMADGANHCLDCGSSFTEGERWVAQAKCKHCGADTTKLTKDPYDHGLFALTFSCGREVHYRTCEGTVKDSGCQQQTGE